VTKISTPQQSSYKTAIARTKLSSPASYVVANKLLVGTSLDFGCGRGTDADILQIVKYDPHWFPFFPQSQFQTILCTYVLNTLPLEEEVKVIKTIQTLLTKSGTAYISVRRDLKKEGLSKLGTLQRNVFLNLPSLTKNSSYEIYVLKNETQN